MLSFTVIVDLKKKHTLDNYAVLRKRNKKQTKTYLVAAWPVGLVHRLDRIPEALGCLHHLLKRLEIVLNVFDHTKGLGLCVEGGY